MIVKIIGKSHHDWPQNRYSRPKIVIHGHEWKSSANRITSDPQIVIHGNECIILYIWNHNHSALHCLINKSANGCPTTRMSNRNSNCCTIYQFLYSLLQQPECDYSSMLKVSVNHRWSSGLNTYLCLSEIYGRSCISMLWSAYKPRL